MHIFQEFAPAYWNAGIPVIPLKRWNSPSKGAGKAPILNEWTQYGNVMPTEAMREHWLVTYPDSNIGLPFGPASNLCAIDIDTEDEALREAIEQVLPGYPYFPWHRVGKKGVGLIFRWQGQPNFKLRDNENRSIVEFLGQGNQMVMPPSIHPDTGKPYTSDTNLWDILDKIMPLPVDIEQILRRALEPILGAKGFSLAQSGRSGPIDVVPQGERDIQMVRHAGYLARVVLGIDKSTKFSLRDAMDHMRTWVEEFTASASGDDMDPDKGVAKLVEFLLKDVESGRTLPEGWDTGLTDEQREHPAIAAMIEKNAIQRWTFMKARDWLDANIALDADNVDWRIACVNKLVESVAKDDQFTEFEFNGLVQNIQKALGKDVKMSKPDIKNLYKSAKRGEADDAADHEAIARMVFDDMSRVGDLRWSMGSFWQWSGSCWKPLLWEEVRNRVAEDVKGNALARRYNDYEAITKTIAMIARQDLVEDFEDGINFANGFLDTNLELHDHSPKFGKTFTMPFLYIPERAGEAHKWFEYLERAWGDDEDYTEKVMALQEAMAAT
ncbi:MAG: bifunctional DNA primase/polymerase, partial [Sphingomonas sp.]|uniref:bifunctional DNA primase/polymerase n=1 Tax=Sphingomonas sp. TaxID=28214 RepID=UPI003F7F52F5